jgi:hypothetical protein
MGAETKENTVGNQLAFPDAIKLKFLEIQYVSLRQEIENAKGRAFYTYALGALIVPATQQFLQYLAGSITQVTGSSPDNTPIFNLDARLSVIRMAFPFLVLAVMFLFLGENVAIKRCGRYIKQLMEEPYFNSRTVEREFMGWETWLTGKRNSGPQENGNPRSREQGNSGPQYAAISFFALFALYYVIFSIVAVLDVYSRSASWILSSIVSIFYAMFGLATQCYFVHEVFYDDPRQKCPIYRLLFERIPGNRIFKKLVEPWLYIKDRWG